MSYRSFGAVESSCPQGFTGAWPFCFPQIENKPCPACTHGIPPYCCPYGQINAGGICVDDPTGLSSKPPPEFEYCLKGGAKPGAQTGTQAPSWQLTPCKDDEIGFSPFCIKKSSIPAPPEGIFCPKGFAFFQGKCLPEGGRVPSGVTPSPQSKGLSTTAKAALGIGGGVLALAAIGAIVYTASKSQQGA